MRFWDASGIVPLLRVHAGWGMRVVFVPHDATHEEPEIEVREPEKQEGDEFSTSAADGSAALDILIRLLRGGDRA